MRFFLKIRRSPRSGRAVGDMENIFGERLKELRRERGVGQVELAKGIGVSNGIISLWEHGLREPTLNNLVAIAKYFGVSADYLVGLSDY